MKHSHDDEVIGLRIDACLDHGDPTSWSSFLRSNGLVERETLNHVARCRACCYQYVVYIVGTWYDFSYKILTRYQYL